MAFNKIGTPTSTISILKQDGKVASFCEKCKAMVDSSMDKKAFVDGKAAGRCGKCNSPL